MKVYFDNAATTRPDPEVVEAMVPYLSEHFGNPSSIHSYGRESKSAIEMARKTIAELVNATPSEIYFTSGGTEADNTALFGLIATFGIKTVISSPLEHHAIIHSIEHLRDSQGIKTIFLDVNEKGEIDFDQLTVMIKQNPHALVTLMHVNNEIGNITDIAEVGKLCAEFDCFFHSDTVQSMGKLPLDLRGLKINTLAGSAHKFHGPKGTGFLYVNGSAKIKPYIHGGGQERNLRSGTENVAGIAGLTKALEIAVQKMDEAGNHIQSMKNHMIKRLMNDIEGVQFNGLYNDTSKNLYNILNVSLPPDERLDMLVFQLDLKGIAASGGSACASGALQGSHVLNAMKTDPERPVVRFSFSRFNSMEEIDYACDTLSGLVKKN